MREAEAGLHSEEEELFKVYIPETKEPPTKRAKEDINEVPMTIEYAEPTPKKPVLNESYKICFRPDGSFYLPGEKGELLSYKLKEHDTKVSESLIIHLDSFSMPKIINKVEGISAFNFKEKEHL